MALLLKHWACGCSSWKGKFFMPKLGKKILWKGGTEIYSHHLSVKKKAMMVSVLHLALVIPNCQVAFSRST